MSSLDEQLDKILTDMLKSIAASAITGDERLPADYVMDAKQQLKPLIEQREREAMEKFGIKKGVEYKVYGSDKVIVLEALQKGES